MAVLISSVSAPLTRQCLERRAIWWPLLLGNCLARASGLGGKDDNGVNAGIVSFKAVVSA